MGRKIRFSCHDTVNDMARRILEIGDLKMQENKGKDGDDYESRSSGLSRSKSDHRLVSEFRRNEESSPPMRRRAFGESRYNRDANKSRTNLNRYGGDDDNEEPAGRSRYRSRFLRGGDDDDDNDRRNSKHIDEDPMTKKERNKVIDTEDCWSVIFSSKKNEHLVLTAFYFNLVFNLLFVYLPFYIYYISYLMIFLIKSQCI